jgi:hypothetical protein
MEGLAENIFDFRVSNVDFGMRNLDAGYSMLDNAA